VPAYVDALEKNHKCHGQALRHITAQSDSPPFGRLDSIAGADVVEKRAVGLVVAVVKGTDQLLLEAYGNADAEGNIAMTANTVIPSAR
jgi:CubicO group peptidase (beta-lactamase class C family)